MTTTLPFSRRRGGTTRALAARSEPPSTASAAPPPTAAQLWPASMSETVAPKPMPPPTIQHRDGNRLDPTHASGCLWSYGCVCVCVWRGASVSRDQGIESDAQGRGRTAESHCCDQRLNHRVLGSAPWTDRSHRPQESGPNTVLAPTRASSSVPCLGRGRLVSSGNNRMLLQHLRGACMHRRRGNGPNGPWPLRESQASGPNQTPATWDT